jgi:hypothetical protein
MNRALLCALFCLPAPDVIAADFATAMMEATFKFDNEGSYATAFLLRRDAPDTALYLVTVAHAWEGITNNTAVLVLRKRKPDGSYERHDYTVTLRRDGKPLWMRHEKHDVAVLRITEPLPVPIAALPASALCDEARLKASGVHLCSPLFVLAFPMGLEGDESGIPVARKGIFASPPLLPVASHPTFLADYTGFKGDSGAPVFIPAADNNQPLIAGITVEQHYFDDNLKGLYQHHYVRTPLGVVKILHAQHVRDTVEAAAKQNWQ